MDIALTDGRLRTSTGPEFLGCQNEGNLADDSDNMMMSYNGMLLVANIIDVMVIPMC